MADARRQDWRNTDAQASEASTTRSWQTKGTTEKSPALPSRRVLRRTVIVTLVFALAITVGILLTLLQGTKAACLVVVGSGYETNLLLPSNVYGWQGALDLQKKINSQEPGGLAKRISDVFGQRAGVRTTNSVPLTGDWASAWQQIASQVQKGGEQGVILYVSAHGFADDQDAYLLSDVSDIKSPDAFNESRISFSKLLNNLKEEEIGRKSVLLLLDVCHAHSCWPIGMLQNDFVERLQAKYGADIKAMPHLTVILSTSPEQLSWPAEEKHMTVFAEFVSRALRGDGMKDRARVTAPELFAFVKDHVNTWAKVNRAREQIPMMLGSGDFKFENSGTTNAPKDNNEKPKEAPKKDEPAKDAKKDESKDKKEDAGKDGVKKEDATKGGAKKEDAGKEKKKEEPPAAKENKEEAPKDAPKKIETPRFNPAQVADAWRKWMVLKRDYAPQVYAPHYWRLYQETLLRYEHLLRAGDPTDKASTLKKKLDGLEKDIKNDKSLEKAFDCLGSSFPMPRVLGFGVKDTISDKQIRTFLDNLGTKAEDREKIDALKPFNGKTELERRYWQLRISRTFINEQLKSEKGFDAKVFRKDLLTIANDLNVLPQRAAEVHLVKMLKDEDVQPSLHVQVDLIKLAVKVRVLAEEAALGVPGENDASELYAEVIFRRNQKAIEEADKLRREGEDRLFGAPSLQRSSADKSLKAAETAYGNVLNSAKQLRLALALRDDMAAELPFYAASAALMPSVDNKTKSLIETMRVKIQSLGDSSPALVRFVEKDDEPRPDLNAIQDDLKSLRDNYTTLCQSLNKLGAKKVQINWHAFNGALSLPPASATAEDTNLRMSLMTKLVETSRELANEVRADAQAEKLEVNVTEQRKLLLASLKPYATEIRESKPKNVEDNVRDFLLRQLSATEKESTDLEHDADLQSAVYRSRALIGYLGDQLVDQRRDRINPAKRLRTLRTYQLLQGLAKRTLSDHWFDPGAKGEPTYYVPVAKSYLDSAAKILQPKDEKLVKELQKLTDKLQTAGLRISAPEKVFWTTQAGFGVQGVIEADKGVPEGLPTVWFEVPKGTEKERDTIRTWLPHTASTPLKESEVAKDGDTPVILHAYYRGQHITKEIPVVRAPPNIIARQTPGPDKVGFAVRMDKVAYGAISIIVDTSGSMTTPHQSKTRYFYALQALRESLSKLEEDTLLSVSYFSNKEGPQTKPKFIKWWAGSSEKNYHPWRQDRLENLMSALDLDEKGLNNNSPICEAVLDSIKDGFPRKFEDPKLIVVLTDGMDNLYTGFVSQKATDKQKDDNSTAVANALRKTLKDNEGVEVIAVCFLDKGDPEYKYAMQQFQPIGFENILVESDGKKLGQLIDDRINRPYIKLSKDGVPAPGFKKGRKVNYVGDGDLEWGPSVERGDYRAGLVSNTATGFELRMTPGDNIFALLKRDGKRFQMERGVIGKEPEVRKANCLSVEKGEWFITLLNNTRKFDGEKRNQLIAFEKTSSESGSIRQVHPGFVWFEVETADGKKVPQTLDWGTDLVVPAPAYSLNVASWPEGFPKVTAWYWPHSWEDLVSKMNPAFDKPIQIAKFQPGDVLEYAKWEESRSVNIMTPAGPRTVQRDCLVIRAKYLDGKVPVYIGLKNKDSRVGSEHQFFDEAGTCTACFYGLPNNQETFDVVVIPIPALKAAAESRDAKVVFAPRDPVSVPAIFRDAIIGAIYGK